MCSVIMSHVIFLKSLDLYTKMAVVKWSPLQEHAQDFAVFGKDLRVYRYELKVSLSMFMHCPSWVSTPYALGPLC